MKFLLGFLTALVLLAVAGYSYFAMGLAPVATSSAPMPFEVTMAHKALRAKIGSDAQKPSPIQPTDENLTAGAQIYRDHCAVCHGLKGQDTTAIAKGMFPKPPQLFVHGVTDDPVGETYWKVANGIRLTGMPSFSGSLTDEQMWQVSLMLFKADKLPQSATEILMKPAGQI